MIGTAPAVSHHLCSTLTLPTKHFQFHHKTSFTHYNGTKNRTTTTRTTVIKCSASSNKPPPPSSTAKIRSEVLTPFRSLRMFFYLAFIASGSLGGLIALSRFISSLSRPSMDKVDILQGLAIDIAAVSLFAFLYYRENSAKNAQIARLSREENLAKLKLRVNQNKTISVSDLRGIARLVLVVGPAEFVKESFKLCLPFTDQLLERGVLVVPFVTDGDLPQFEFQDDKDDEEGISVDKRKRLWQLLPVNTWEWSRWLNDQKKLAKVSPEAPVYLSLRMDGRVRGSGIGYPPWNAFVAQLPPVKGLWSGLLDGMDGRV